MERWAPACDPPIPRCWVYVRIYPIIFGINIPEGSAWIQAFMEIHGRLFHETQETSRIGPPKSHGKLNRPQAQLTKNSFDVFSK